MSELKCKYLCLVLTEEKKNDSFPPSNMSILNCDIQPQKTVSGENAYVNVSQ